MFSIVFNKEHKQVKTIHLGLTSVPSEEQLEISSGPMIYDNLTESMTHQNRRWHRLEI